MEAEKHDMRNFFKISFVRKLRYIFVTVFKLGSRKLQPRGESFTASVVSLPRARNGRVASELHW